MDSKMHAWLKKHNLLKRENESVADHMKRLSEYRKSLKTTPRACEEDPRIWAKLALNAHDLGEYVPADTLKAAREVLANDEI